METLCLRLEALATCPSPLPRLTTEEVRAMLDPVKLIERHSNVGDPHPDESRRMITARREQLAHTRQRHQHQLERIKNAEAKLETEVETIIGE